MAIVLKDRVKETASAPGTGTITLGGASTGFQAFSAIGNGNVTYFAIVDSASGAWEVNYGTYTASGTTLSRNATPLSSSAAGSLVNFTGSVEVFCTYPSEKAIYEETTGNVLIDGGPITVIGTGVTAYTTFSAALGELYANINSFAQFYAQNYNDGTEASGDFVVYRNDATNDTSKFVDMGINSSNYSSATYPIFTPGSAYVFNDGSEMFIGSATHDLILFAGGVTAADEAVRIDKTTKAMTTVADVNVGGALDTTGAATFGSTVALSANPTLALQAATKQYVDEQVTAGIHIHEPVLVETTGNLTASYTQGGTTFDITTITGNKTLTTSVNHGLSLNDQIWLYSTAGNGLLTNTAYFVFSTPALNQITVSLTYGGAEVTGLTNATGLVYNTRANSGVGAKLTNSGTQVALVVDNVTLASTNRVMVRLQTNPAQNGVYTVTNIGSISTNWELTRATDANKVAPADPLGLGTGDYFYTQDGDINAGDSHVLTTEPNTMIIGYTGLTYTQFSGAVTYTGAAPIDVTGQTISLTGTVAATNGGTGTATVTTGDLLYGSATNTWGKLPLGVAYRSLSVNAAGTQVEWNAVALDQANAVAGSLGATNGGTGQSSYAVGDMLYSAATNTLTKLSGNTTTTKRFLSQTGTGAISAAPTWDTISGSDVTGNISGQAGSVANALTAGSFLTSGGTYDGSAARTFAVDATDANTASKVVARDASGNFSAGTITATLSGSATSATTATNLAGGAANQIAYQTGAGATSFAVAPTASNQVLNWNGSAFTWSAGTISGIPLGSNLSTLTFGTYLTGTSYNGSSAVTLATNATSANTVSTLVARDVSGNFSAGTITATLSGNATTATTAANVNNGTLTMNVSGTGLSGSQTFTANQSTAATFTVTSNATNANTASTIVARDASGNFSAGTITAALTGTASNATTAGGLAVNSTGTNNVANQIVRTDSNGYANFGWINTVSGDNSRTALGRIYASQDAYLRYYTPANFNVVLNRAVFNRETNGGTMVAGNIYSIYTGGGAITMYVPTGANTAQGDVIVINNLLLTWATAAFTVGINTNARIMNLNESMTCNINVGSIVLMCAYHDGTTAYWNVAPGG